MRFLLLVAFGFSAAPALGMYIQPMLEKVPVAKLVENLEKTVKDEPKSVEALLNLGRAHGMAYAQKVAELPVWKGREKNGAWPGFEPPFVPFSGNVQKTDDKEKLAAAQAHLAAALKAYTRALELDKENLVVRLGIAWLTEQQGKKDEAVKLYRAVATDAWEKKEKDLKALGIGGRTLTAEIAGYLTPLLDKEKDKAEIDTLKDRVATLKKLPYPITPIAVPLADGLTAADLEDREAAVKFDVNGTGARPVSWITPKAAWLVYDPKADGKITSGLQLFGNVTFWMFWSNGYGPLTALDDNRDGELRGKELTGLALWHDENGNGVSDPGEVKPLADYGIVAVSCKWETLKGHPEKIAFSPAGVTFKDGKTRPTFDLILKAK